MQMILQPSLTFPVMSSSYLHDLITNSFIKEKSIMGKKGFSTPPHRAVVYWLLKLSWRIIGNSRMLHLFSKYFMVHLFPQIMMLIYQYTENWILWNYTKIKNITRIKDLMGHYNSSIYDCHLPTHLNFSGFLHCWGLNINCGIFI